MVSAYHLFKSTHQRLAVHSPLGEGGWRSLIMIEDHDSDFLTFHVHIPCATFFSITGHKIP